MRGYVYNISYKQQYISVSPYPPRTRLIVLPEHEIGEAIISKRFVIAVMPNMN